MITPTDTEMLDWLERHKMIESGWSLRTGSDMMIISAFPGVKMSSLKGFGTVRELITSVMNLDSKKELP
jgi:hypothetical protein